MTDQPRRDFIASLAATSFLLPGTGLAQPAGPGKSLPRNVGGHTNPRLAPFFARGDGLADDTRSIQEAINAAIISPRRANPGNRGGAVFVPSGVYRITNTILIRDTQGLRFAGASPGGTLFIWDGPPDKPMFLLQDVRDSIFIDFQIRSWPHTPLHTGIQTENAQGGFYAPSQNQFEHLMVNGTQEGLQYGFRVAKGSGGDRNNDFHEFVRCKVRNYTKAGFTVEHSQSHTNRFYSCSFNAYSRGEAGVKTVDGSFSWFGGGGGGNTVADFVLGKPNVIISVINANFEDSARLLLTGPSSGAAWPIMIQGVRWPGGKMHKDRIIIDVGNPGPLVLKNNLFGSTGNAHIPRVRLRTNVPGNSLISQGNVWSGQDAYEVSPYEFTGHGAGSVNATIEGDVFAEKGQREVTTLPDGENEPTVHYSRWFKTGNSRPTVVSNFRNGWPGAQIKIIVTDKNTSFDFVNGNLRQYEARYWRAKPGQTLNCIYDGELWHCHSG